MKIAIIGRTEILYETAIMLSKNHEITCIVTSKESAEYTKSSKDYKELAEKFGIQLAFEPFGSKQIPQNKPNEVEEEEKNE